MEANTEAIIRLAWARILRLADDALTPPVGPRLYREDDTAVMFVRLFGHSVFSGPAWACERARVRSDDELTTVRALLQISADHHGRALGHGVLAFTDAYVDIPAMAEVVSSEPEAVAALERSCPPDDVDEVGLAPMARTFVLVEEHRPEVATAGAGYDEWGGILGHIGVLTVPGRRRTGRARAIAAVATNDALDAGLVPQWRARVDNVASRRTAAALGYVESGSQTTVLLPVRDALS